MQLSTPAPNTITQSLTATGTIQWAAGSLFYLPEGLLVEAVFVSEGEAVQEGDKIAALRREDVEQMKKYKMPDSICDNPKQQIGYWFENGVQLSGGQWQRLAICRTMARDNEILLLDEPNAALDAITFRMLYNEINAQANRKVCVMLLQHFVNFIGGNEEICVFDDGKLISRGKHDRLYDTCRIYKELYDAQQ